MIKKRNFYKKGIAVAAIFGLLTYTGNQMLYSLADSQEAVVTENIEAMQGASSTQIHSLVLTPGADKTSICLTWFSSTNAPGLVEFETDQATVESGNGIQVEVTSQTPAASVSGYYVNKACITDLSPGETYYYRVGNGSDFTETHSYTVMGSVSHNEFFFGSDAQLPNPSSGKTYVTQWKDNIAVMSKEFPDTNLLIHAGDQADSGSHSGGEVQYTDGFLAPDNFKSMIVGTVPGNHDEMGSSTGSYVSGSSYSDHFNNPNQSDVGSFIKTPGDYYFTYHNILFMCLTSHTVAATDSNLSKISDHVNFMKQAMEANPDCDWHVIVFHESIYANATHSNSIQSRSFRNRFSPEIEKLDNEYGIDLVLMGHDHSYSRTYMMQGTLPLESDNITTYNNPDGVIYVTANCASGYKLYTPLNLDYNYLAVCRQDSTPTLSHITVDTTADKSTLAFSTYISKNVDGNPDTTSDLDSAAIDQFTITKDISSNKMAKKKMYSAEGGSGVRAELPAQFSANEVSLTAKELDESNISYQTLANAAAANKTFSGFKLLSKAYNLTYTWDGKASRKLAQNATIYLPMPEITAGYHSLNDSNGNLAVYAATLSQDGSVSEIKSSRISVQEIEGKNYIALQTKNIGQIGISLAIEADSSSKVSTADYSANDATSETDNALSDDDTTVPEETDTEVEEESCDGSANITGSADGASSSKTITVKIKKFKATKKAGKVRLHWKKSKKAVSYNIYSSTKKKGTYQKIATVKKAKYKDKSVQAGKTYYYKITANVIQDGETVECSKGSRIKKIKM